MTINNGDNLRISVRQSMPSGQDHVNVFHYHCDFTGTETNQDVADAAIYMLDGAYAQINGFVSDDMTPIDVKIDKVEFADEKLEIIENVGTYPFATTYYIPGSTGDPLPPGVAGLLKLLTTAGKTYGRKFLGALTEGNQTDGTLGSTVLTAIGLMGAQLVSSILVSTGNYLLPGVMSYRDHDFRQFTDYEASDNLAYQRRRRAGTGS